LPSLLALLLFTGVMPEPPPQGFHDRPAVGADGTVLIVRTGRWPDLADDQRQVDVEQVLVPNPDGSFTYRYARQSLATRVYHQTLCARDGMEASTGESVLSGSGTYGGWVCSSVQEHPAPTPEGP